MFGSVWPAKIFGNLVKVAEDIISRKLEICPKVAKNTENPRGENLGSRKKLLKNRLKFCPRSVFQKEQKKLKEKFVNMTDVFWLEAHI